MDAKQNRKNEKKLEKEQLKAQKKQNKETQESLVNIWKADVPLMMKLENSIFIIGRSLLGAYRIYLFAGLGLSLIFSILAVIFKWFD